MQVTLYPNCEIRARVPATPRSNFFVARGKRDFPVEGLDVLSCLSFKSCDKKEATKDGHSGGSFLSGKSQDGLRPGWGAPARPTDFSLYARRKIVRCGALLCSEEERVQSLFLTGTLPGGTDAALRAIADWSGWIVHELLSSIPRWWGGTASSCRFIWVWEWQKRGALHWHCVLVCPSVEASCVVREKFADLWIRVIRSVSDRTGVDLAERAEGGTWADSPEAWRVEAEPARKNPSRYLAKYCSKAKTPSSPDSPYPSRWYGISRSLHRELTEKTLQFSPGEASESTPAILGPQSQKLLIELESLCYKTVSFVDKVRDGFTSVFYFDEEIKGQIIDLLGGLGFKPEIFQKHEKKELGMKYFYLQVLRNYPRALARFESDVGEFDCKVYRAFLDGYEVPERELHLLNRFARRILIYEGVVAEVNPAIASETRVDDSVSNKMESSSPPQWDYDQSSLFP